MVFSKGCADAARAVGCGQASAFVERPCSGARGVSAVTAFQQFDAGERRGRLRGPRESLNGGKSVTRSFPWHEGRGNQESNRVIPSLGYAVARRSGLIQGVAER